MQRDINTLLSNFQVSRVLPPHAQREAGTMNDGCEQICRQNFRNISAPNDALAGLIVPFHHRRP
jgi:hypothetical protein